MRPEVRRLSFALAGVVALAAPAWSEGPVTPAAAPAGAGRYALNAARDGFVRLDTATGAVSHCSQEAGVWHCDTIAGEDATLKRWAMRRPRPWPRSRSLREERASPAGPSIASLPWSAR